MCLTTSFVFSSFGLPLVSENCRMSLSGLMSKSTTLLYFKFMRSYPCKYELSSQRQEQQLLTLGCQHLGQLAWPHGTCGFLVCKKAEDDWSPVSRLQHCRPVNQGHCLASKPWGLVSRTMKSELNSPPWWQPGGHNWLWNQPGSRFSLFTPLCCPHFLSWQMRLLSSHSPPGNSAQSLLHLAQHGSNFEDSSLQGLQTSSNWGKMLWLGASCGIN